MSETTPLIGERVVLTVEVSCLSGAKVEWPNMKECFGSYEVLYKDVSTTSLNEGLEKQRLEVTLTNFTPGTHTIHALPVKVSTPNSLFVLHSEQITIQYSLPTVDLTLPFKDIHPSIGIEYSHAELLPYKIGSGLTITIIIILLLLLFTRHSSPHWIIFPHRAPQYYRRAVKSLAELEKSDDIHNQLSVVLRTYIQERFTISIKSATTQEVISQLKVLNIEDDNLRNIACVLEETDGERFASIKNKTVDTNLLLKTSKAFVLGTNPIK
ncbi:hypothetical protein [Pontibacter saemangeumensis]|uniref:hypothetical protein n=1 Tax=Pontibacter saemangeumensis TaxID=1084525 RepID=UPI0031ECFF0D